ncbi:MAG: EAL domain-containing protein [Pseudomonadota bacterium]|nr:EAL domain-containing protein [Pseudomonadota bacterium]
MEFTAESDPLRLLVLSTSSQQLQTLRHWLAHYQEQPAPAATFLPLDQQGDWLSHPALSLSADIRNLWHAAVILVDDLCEQRCRLIGRLQQHIPTLLISSAGHRDCLPAPFHWLGLDSISRQQLFRGLRPLLLCGRRDLPAPLSRHEFFARLRQRLQAESQPLYLQIAQSRWLRDHQAAPSWHNQQHMQQEFERAVSLHAPADALLGQLLDNQLVIVSRDPDALRSDWLPQQPLDDLRPWVACHSSALSISTFDDLSAVLLESVQQIARERLCDETQLSHHQPQQSLSLFDGLHLALQREEFYLEYQPQFDSRSGAWTGAEALMRWRHPLLGIVPPTVFIREAEAAGLIRALGQWALRESAGAWQRLRRATGQSIRLAVNVSFPEIADPGYAGQVLNLLADSAMPAHCLELELTETAIMHDPEVSLLNLRQLKAAGIHIVLDDFGTGFSSLSHLSDLPLTGIKLDRAFVSALPANGPQAHIVTSMLELAQRLELETTAEGVEESAGLEVLRRLGCDRIQGYLCSRPLALDELIRQAGAGFPAAGDFAQGRLF